MRIAFGFISFFSFFFFPFHSFYCYCNVFNDNVEAINYVFVFSRKWFIRISYIFCIVFSVSAVQIYDLRVQRTHYTMWWYNTIQLITVNASWAWSAAQIVHHIVRLNIVRWYMFVLLRSCGAGRLLQNHFVCTRRDGHDGWDFRSTTSRRIIIIIRDKGFNSSATSKVGRCICTTYRTHTLAHKHRRTLCA